MSHASSIWKPDETWAGPSRYQGRLGPGPYFEGDGAGGTSPAQFSDRAGYNRDGEKDYELENGAYFNELETKRSV